MQLQRLTGLERQKILDELAELMKTIERLRAILAERRAADADRRRRAARRAGRSSATSAAPRSSKTSGEFRIEDLIADEDVAITVTNTGYIKRTPITTYRTQRRGGKGRIGMRTREEDFVSHLFVASTHAYIMIFTDRGRAYWLKVHEIPDVGADGKGKAIANLVQMEAGEKIAAMLAVQGVRRGPAVRRHGHAQGHRQEDRADRRSPTRAPAASSRWASRKATPSSRVQLSDGQDEIVHRHARRHGDPLRRRRRPPDGPHRLRRPRHHAARRRRSGGDGGASRRAARS